MYVYMNIRCLYGVLSREVINVESGFHCLRTFSFNVQTSHIRGIYYILCIWFWPNLVMSNIILQGDM
jgi:hypothetical protein